MESTLIVENAGEVNQTGLWGFGRLDGDNSNIPESYIDSVFLDTSEDNYGIGIVNPNKLTKDIVYDYWMELLEDNDWFAVKPQDLKIDLRFRLNIDLVAAKKFGYSQDEIERDFVLGTCWSGCKVKGYGNNYGYVNIDVSQAYSAQDIGKYFSFAIEKYKKGSNFQTYSYVFVLSSMDGQWCKDLNGEATQVNSLEECFGIEASNSPPAKSESSMFPIGNNNSSGTNYDTTSNARVKVKKIELSDDGNKNSNHVLEKEPDKKFNIHIELENTGSDTAHNVEIRYYISRDKTFGDGDDKYIGSDYINSIDEHSFYEDRKIKNSNNIPLKTPLELGEYYIYAKVINHDSMQKYTATLNRLNFYLSVRCG